MTAVNTIGSLHAEIVPKHTSRLQNVDDGDEMICRAWLDTDGKTEIANPNWDLDGCDVKYEKNLLVHSMALKHPLFGIDFAKVLCKLLL